MHASSPNASQTQQARQSLVGRLFPAGIPPLWCPTLTHFSAQGKLDRQRIVAHLSTLATHVRGILVPGSTGEGWEMSEADIRDLLDVVLEATRLADIHVLIGVLNTNADTMLACMDSTVAWLKSRTGASRPEDAMAKSNVVGFTVCPPRGSDLSQVVIFESLCSVLDRRLPTALYQLPQVTGNEIRCETVCELAAEYPNFFLFKDTSGQDRVACAGLDLGGVFLVRGAEGDYARWPRSAGGPYDGFLLSTANVFAPQFSSLLDSLSGGQNEQAVELSRRVERVVKESFGMVAGFSAGNPFTNANKVLDHVMAYGAAALDHEPPLLYTGVRLPAEFVRQALDLLRSAQLLPKYGYLEDQTSS